MNLFSRNAIVTLVALIIRASIVALRCLLHVWRLRWELSYAGLLLNDSTSFERLFVLCFAGAFLVIIYVS